MRQGCNAFPLQVLPLTEGKTHVMMEYYVHPSKVTHATHALCSCWPPSKAHVIPVLCIYLSYKYYCQYVRPWAGQSEYKDAGKNARHHPPVQSVMKVMRVHVQLDDKAWIDAVVTGEDIVQREDMHMCDLVQGGLASPAYDVGRCAAFPAAPSLHP